MSPAGLFFKAVKNKNWPHTYQRLISHSGTKCYCCLKYSIIFSTHFLISSQKTTKYLSEGKISFDCLFKQAGGARRREEVHLERQCPAHNWFLYSKTEPVFLNVYGAQESIPRNEFRQPMYPGGPVRQLYSSSVPSPHRLFTNSSSVRYSVPLFVQALHYTIVISPRPLHFLLSLFGRLKGTVWRYQKTPFFHG